MKQKESRKIIIWLFDSDVWIVTVNSMSENSLEYKLKA